MIGISTITPVRTKGWAFPVAYIRGAKHYGCRT